MNRANQNHHHHSHHHHQQDHNESQAQNNNSFQDYLQNSAHNLSFTNLHQNTSFDMDQENNHHQLPAHNIPLSPPHRTTNYIPQSFLSKPFEDNTYDEVEQRSQQWKLNWTQHHGNANNSSTPLAGNAAQLQNFEIAQTTAQAQQAKDSLWDSNYINDHNASNAINHDLELTSSAVINNFSGVLNDNTLFHDAKDTPMHNRHPYRQNSLHDNFGMDMEEDFHPSQNRFNHNQMDIEHFDQSGTPNLFKKNAANIIMNYDNYQQSIKVSDIAKTPYKNSSTINNNSSNNHLFDSITNKIQPNKSFNYLFNNAGDHLNNDFRFSPIKSTKNIPFVTPSYFADKYEPGYNHFADAAPTSDDFSSPKMEELQQNQQQNNNQSGNSNPQNMNTNQSNPANPSQQTTQPCVCNCKKTKCLKLYCECFAKLGYCGEGCHCHECKNRPENEDERQNAIQEAKSRNIDAFQPKTESEQERKNKANNEQMKKGCNCRKTKCLKKYCECFNAGTYCNNMCKCDSCENHPRNAALILQKKNGSCGPQMASNIIQHHPTETVPPGLVVSQYNSGGYFQNTYNSLSLHQHVQSQHNRNQPDSHFLHPSQIYKSNKLQGRILFDDNNEESDPNNFYTKHGKETSKYLLNKLRKQKKPIIKNRREGLDNSDEDIENQSQDLSSQQSITLMRAGKRASNTEQNILSKDLDNSDEEYQQQKQIEDMEKKLKQIQQMQLLLQQQQLLKQEQEKLLNQNQSSYKDQQDNPKQGNGSPQQILDGKLKKQKEELEHQFTTNGWTNHDSSQQRFISPPSSNFTHHKDDDIEEEEYHGDKDKDEQEHVKAHQILNGIKKNKKKHLKKKEQLSEEKKHQQKEKAKEKYISYDEDQESSVSYSNYSTLTQYNQQNIFNNNNSSNLQANSQFRNRLNSENYESIRQKSIQYNCQFSLLSSNPTKCSSNLFDPTSYSRQSEDLYNKEIFPFESQRIKKNSAHIIKAP